MDEKLKKHLDELSAPLKESIAAAMKVKEVELKEAAEAQARVEFAEKFEADRALLVNSINDMVQEELKEAIDGLKAEKAEIEAKSKKIDEAVATIKDFALKEAASIANDINADRKSLNEAFEKLANFGVESVLNEKAEVEKEKASYLEKKVELIAEGAKQMKLVRKALVREAAKDISKITEETINSEIKNFRKDILESKKAKLGMKLYESIKEEFEKDFFNKDASIQAYSKELKKRNDMLSESLKAIEMRDQKVSEIKSELSQLKEEMERERIIYENISCLPLEKQRVMRDLIKGEKVSTLVESIKKYLPYVLKGSNQAEKVQLHESKVVAPKVRVVTGDQKQVVESSDDSKALKESLDEILKYKNM